MIRVKDITNYLEKWAPLSYQEAYDNAGLLVGEPTLLVNGILICLDVTEEVIEEARQQGCNLVIAHHPIIFQGIKRITGATYVERCIIQAIKCQIAIYAMHTNVDNIAEGVSQCIAQQLDLRARRILLPKPHTLQKLTTYVPIDAVDQVRDALHQAGAGHIGNYTHCSFSSAGTGTFQPNEFANPSIGQRGMLEKVVEHKLEVIYPSYLSKSMVASLQQAHPYEEVAYQIQNIENPNQQVGAGMIGELSQPLDTQSFLRYLQDKMQLIHIRHSAPISKPIKKVALCGGAGIFLLSEAIQQGVDAFVTADVKYHSFFDAEGKLLLADIGHYESEVAIKELIYSKLSKKFSNIACVKSTTQTNPVHYFS